MGRHRLDSCFNDLDRFDAQGKYLKAISEGLRHEARKKAAGLCKHHGCRLKAEEGRPFCEAHRLTRNTWARLGRKRRKELKNEN